MSTRSGPVAFQRSGSRSGRMSNTFWALWKALTATRKRSSWWTKGQMQEPWFPTKPWSLPQEAKARCSPPAPGMSLTERVAEVRACGQALKSAKTVVFNGSGLVGVEAWSCWSRLLRSFKAFHIFSESTDGILLCQFAHFKEMNEPYRHGSKVYGLGSLAYFQTDSFSLKSSLTRFEQFALNWTAAIQTCLQSSTLVIAVKNLGEN